MNLRIKGVQKTYSNGHRALEEINLEIGTGMFGLLGPNGAGKSTLMRTLATLQDPDAGEIYLGELDVVKQKDEVRKVLGYLPQDFGFYPKVSAEEMLGHFAVLKGVSDKKQRRALVEGLLEQTNLLDSRKRALSDFSGGMRQRFGIAQALIGNPQLIIVDEPTAGLDPIERNRFHNLLSEIGENIIVILSTHIVDDVKELCARMVILDRGKIILEGTPADAIKSVKGKIFSNLIEKDQMETFKGKYNIISSKIVEGKMLITVLQDANPGEGFEAIEPGLEDVYFSCISKN